MDHLPAQPTPEQLRQEALQKYFTCVMKLRERGEGAAGSIHTEVVMLLDDILGGLDMDNPLLKDSWEVCIPDDYETCKVDGVKVEDWTNALRLAPLRLMACGFPDQESLNPRYIKEVFRIALEDENIHSSACYTGPQETDVFCKDCLIARLCPPKVACFRGFQMIDMLSANVAFSEMLLDQMAAARGQILITQVMSEMHNYDLMPAQVIRETANHLLARARTS